MKTLKLNNDRLYEIFSRLTWILVFLQIAWGFVDVIMYDDKPNDQQHMLFLWVGLPICILSYALTMHFFNKAYPGESDEFFP